MLRSNENGRESTWHSFKTLPEGATVLFKAAQGQKGPQAEEVEVV